MERKGGDMVSRADDEDIPQEGDNISVRVPKQVGDPVEDKLHAAPGAPDDGGDDDATASTRSTKASWSVTGSTFNGTAYSMERPHLRFPRPPVAQQQVESGVPFVQFSLPRKLNDLKERSIENFLYEYFSVRTNVPNLRIQGLLSRQVYSAVQFRRVDVKSDLKILAYLQSHLMKHEAKKKENSLITLQQELTWKHEGLLPAEQIYFFFDTVYDILKYYDKKDKKKSLPPEFNLNKDNVDYEDKSYSIETLKRKLLSRQFVLEVLKIKKKIGNMKTKTSDQSSQNTKDGSFYT
eukprot:snap_masked-scaffold_4-processed-gene-3.22-mRNA-1 protein AED:1.00 eAED:1.00 QI:0/0/0/0/1/1/2/0/292